MKTEASRYMADNIGFPKLEAMLSTMSSEDFSDCLAYTHLKVTSIGFAFKLSVKLIQYFSYLSFFYFSQGLFLSKALKNKRNVEVEAARKEMAKLRSEVYGLQFKCEEKEISFKILEKDFIES
jgi:hypothetical protein